MSEATSSDKRSDDPRVPASTQFSAATVPMRSQFEVHKLSDWGQDKARHIANAFNGLVTQLQAIGCPEGREMSIVMTKLEEACFFAKKAMAKANTEEG